MKTLFSLNEVTLIPAEITTISHRNECNPFYENKKLPLFAAPMSCVINLENYSKFEEQGINVVLPRNIDFSTRCEKCINKNGTFSAFSLEEARKFLDYENIVYTMQKEGSQMHVCIDVANGHMRSLIHLCKDLKDKFGDTIQLMVGNIARPSTFVDYAKAGVDYVRIGIGGGNVCTTSVCTGVHYPMGSLIEECKKTAGSLRFTDVKHTPKIVADGGFKNYDQIIKALALGADYVMLGEIFAKSEEACGEWGDRFMPKDGWSEEDKKHLIWDMEAKCYKQRIREYYGMSTKQAQIEFGKKGDKVEEGIHKWVYIDYTIKDWIIKFKASLQSAMSYTNCKTIEAFKNNVTWFHMTPSAYNSYMK